MPYLLCRNRVKDVAAWRAIFSSHRAAHEAAGLHLIQIWPSREDANNLFFLFEVSDMSRAEAFINAPEGAKAGEAAGVLDGEYHFFSEPFGY